jgi:thiosulfate reductase cytochrome b subunit
VIGEAAPAVSVASVAEPVEASTVQPAVSTSSTVDIPLRRGLPRVAGGDPWPAAGVAEVAASLAVPAPSLIEPVEMKQEAALVSTSSNATPAAFDSVTEEVTLRQGLPRTVGGDPWPAAATVAVERKVASAPVSPAADIAPEALPAVAVSAAAVTASEAVAAVPALDQPEAPTPAPASTLAPAPTSTQAPTPASAESAAPAAPTKPAREPRVVRGRTLGQWAKLAVLWGGGAILAAAIIVLAARGVTTLPGVPEFLKRYSGEYHLPEFVDPGFPAWARWSHFLNFFLMVLIIRSGLLVRQQQKPDAFFTPKKGGKKISIYLWLHTSLDLLWLANGVFFVVLLFVSGHWARIVPTSWEVFPNAASAALQYLTLEWPVEDGWVNYNSLQQLMYFTVVFVAAPLAAITGVRMSEWWPKNAEKLNKAYPAPVARAIHFPVMLFFVLFILVHVFLVFTTGALKNLNHMFVGTPEPSWLGFWMFALGLLVTAAVTWAARPLVLAPIAGVFGRVSER